MNYKKKLLSISIVGPFLHTINDIIHLSKNNEHYWHQLNSINADIKTINASTDHRINKFEQISHKELDNLQLSIDNLHRQLNLLENMEHSIKSHPNTKDLNNKDLLAKNHFMDVFYANFEDTFRGSEELIIERLKEYIKYFTNSKINFGKYPVMDIGSGRGEFLQLLKESDIESFGIDINADMVDRTNHKGLDVHQADALEYLQHTEAQSIGAITGFQIVEHIPFGQLLKIFSEAHRVLIRNGFVIFETPNPENIIVGSYSFHIDPSHLNPIPPNLLAYCLKISGFTNINIYRLHPEDNQPQDMHNLPEELINLLYGPRDYAIIGYK